MLVSCSQPKFLAEPNAVKVGMSWQQVIEEWGRPYKINTTTTTYGKRVQYVYRLQSGSIYEAAYVYFENGKVVTIQK